jgi:uncharacterized protein DUF6879
MGRKLTDAQFDELFDTYRYTAWRLEPRDRYHTETSAEPLRRYLAGELTDYSFMDRWTGEVRSWNSEGKRMSRVHAYLQLFTEYANSAVYGAAARTLISRVLSELSTSS